MRRFSSVIKLINMTQKENNQIKEILKNVFLLTFIPLEIAPVIGFNECIKELIIIFIIIFLTTETLNLFVFASAYEEA